MDRLLKLDFDGKNTAIEPILEVSNEMTMIMTEDSSARQQSKRTNEYQSPDMDQVINRQNTNNSGIPAVASLVRYHSPVASPHNYSVQNDDQHEEEDYSERSPPNFTELEIR